MPLTAVKSSKFVSEFSVQSVVPGSALSGECKGDLNAELCGDVTFAEEALRPCHHIS